MSQIPSNPTWPNQKLDLSGFETLPLELRLMIWKLAPERRTILGAWGSNPTRNNKVGFLNLRHPGRPARAINLVNREARFAAQELKNESKLVILYKAAERASLVLGNKDKKEPLAQIARWYARKQPPFYYYFNPETDVIELMGCSGFNVPGWKSPNTQLRIGLLTHSLALSVRHVSLGKKNYLPRDYVCRALRSLADAVLDPDVPLETVTVSAGRWYQFRICRAEQTARVLPPPSSDMPDCGGLLREEKSLLFPWCEFLKPSRNSITGFEYRHGEENRVAIFLIMRPRPSVHFPSMSLPNVPFVPAQWASTAYLNWDPSTGYEPVLPFSWEAADDMARWAHHMLHRNNLMSKYKLRCIPFHGICRPDFRLPVLRANQPWANDAWESKVMRGKKWMNDPRSWGYSDEQMSTMGFPAVTR